MRLTHLESTIAWIRLRLGDERGFTMVTALGTLFVVSILSATAIAAAGGDIRLSRYDQDDKQAYAAAEAGINDYLAHLNEDSNYWAQCTGPVGNPYPAVNQEFTGAAPAARKWRAVPGSSSHYSIELVHRTDKTICDTADPVGSMIDDDGNFTIRATGAICSAPAACNAAKNKRAITSTFRRTGFLDYLYFTDLENKDPTYLNISLDGSTTRSTNSSGVPDGGPDLLTWAADKCERHWWGTQAGGEGRAELPQWRGQTNDGGGWDPAGSSDTFDTKDVCGEIQFATDDRVRGPFHSNDDILLCGTPDFGRSGKNDRVEVTGDGWRSSCGSAAPNFYPGPALAINAARLDLPPSNGAIKQQTDSAYLFSGPTTLRVAGNNVTVTNAQRNGGAAYTVPLPGNGVIFVQNIACSFGYKPDDTDALDPGCGTARVSGNYASDLTIAAEDDIIIDGNFTRSGSSATAVLGLVANNFIRIWHPVDNPGSSCGNRPGTPPTGSPINITVDAAILSLGHSFTVDNYGCGAPLGDLTINGVIAQKHRGIVGTGGSTVKTGYVKDNNYDERLKYRSPPYFLDPVQAAWRTLRQSEQTPAR